MINESKVEFVPLKFNVDGDLRHCPVLPVCDIGFVRGTTLGGRSTGERLQLRPTSRNSTWEGGVEAFAIARVQLSFASIVATPTGSERFASAFYTALWAENPGLRELFPAGMESMRNRFATAVGWAVNRLSDFAAVEDFLGQLARDHRKYGGVKPEHFRAAGGRRCSSRSANALR